MSTWNEQWDRVKRYYDRFKKINNGFEGHGEPSDYYFDDMGKRGTTATIKPCLIQIREVEPVQKLLLFGFAAS